MKYTAPGYYFLTHEEWTERYIASRAEAGFRRSVAIPDPTPMAPPLGYKPQPSLREQIRAMVMSERLRAEAEAAGAETFEESEDFDVGDFDPHSPYEVDFDPVEALRQSRAEALRIREEADRRDAIDNPPPAPKAGPGPAAAPETEPSPAK